MRIFPLDVRFYIRYVVIKFTIDGAKIRSRGNAMNMNIPLDSGQRWEWLKYQLRKRGTSLAQVADELGVTRTAVLNAKYLPYPRMERAIAKQLDLAPGQIWPERWNADGTPCRQRPNRAEKSASISSTHVSGSNASAHRQRAVEA